MNIRIKRMMRELLFDLFAKAVQDFYRREQRNLELDVHEVCHAHRLAVYFEQRIRAYDNEHFSNLFEDYDVDIEVNRTEGGYVKRLPGESGILQNIRCDLLLESRGRNEQENLFVLELKKSNGNEGNDRERLKRMVGPAPANSHNPIYNTLLGVFLKISCTGCKGTKYWYENGRVQEENFEWTYQPE